jgi:hypothetical protein
MQSWQGWHDTGEKSKMKWTGNRAWTVAYLVAASLLLADLAGASTILSLTGSGDLSVTSTGAVYFDASGLAATDLNLTATDRIEIGVAFPAGVPDPASTPLTLSDISADTNLVLDGDVFFDVLAFSGSVSFIADSIHVIGAIQASGDVVLTSSSITLTDAGLINAGTTTQLCTPDSGAVISTGGLSAGCSVTGPIDGGGLGGPISPGDPSLVGPVPEPRAALLFFLGTTVLAVRRWF